ncbi:MAG: signal recognition particle protein [Armatimonadetes bacterium]|nr:signal recognition particle protein [Armatimonadota bacterium]MDE2205332.1 signal recognition particle protein [Armatimonadota bacterium]
MFDTLSDKLQGVFQRLRGKGRVTAADVEEAMREVRLALLEADVNYKVVKDFVATVSEQARGADVLETLQPAQQVVKIVNDELIRLLGGAQSTITSASQPPTVIMLCGLQGSGKTTLCGKLALHFKKLGRRPLMAACDIYRPAAIRQLQVLGEQIELPVYASDPAERKSPPTIARDAVKRAVADNCDLVLLDTAGRLHIDADLMDEVGQMKAWVKPHEVLLVVDAMVGQDAVNFAEQFNRELGITGFVMTKMDGDARGGAALSIHAVTGVPIKFLGVGEKLDALEPFYPERMAQRILGMGDILSLIEKAQEAIDEKSAAEIEKKLRSSRFDLNDFLEQMQQMKKMGPIENLLKLLPGVNSAMLNDVKIDPNLLPRKEAIVRSMTRAERSDPSLINGSRRSRIAIGCGQSVHDVNTFLDEFDKMRKMMRTMMTQPNGKRPGLRHGMKALQGMQGPARTGRRPKLPFSR